MGGRTRAAAGPDFAIEREFWDMDLVHVAGVDEAGRGCLAGPVVAAAVILHPDRPIPGLNDSKKLTASVRDDLAEQIREHAVALSVGRCSPAEIDRLNILHASLEAMRRAVAGFITPAGTTRTVAEQNDLIPAVAVLVDGNRMWPNPGIPWRTVVGGDARSRSIAAASIIAKTVRDATMTDLATEFPEFGWDRNKGYPTQDHFAALARFGPTIHHRRSFRLRIGSPVHSDLFSHGH